MAALLDPADRPALLAPLGESGWAAVPGKDALRKIVKFASFAEAWGAMSRIALAAEKLNHHPDWTNRYNMLDVTLTTHDAHGLTRLDIDLARAIDRACATAEVIRNHGEPVSCLCETRASRKA